MSDGTVLLDPDPADDVDYEPTSVDVLGNRYALVAVNTSESFIYPSGMLFVIDIPTRVIVDTLDLGGQPDSIAISPDERYVAVAIENERDEDVEVDGVEGGLPQAPAGYLVVIDIIGANPANWVRHDVDLGGLAAYGTWDPEPEFVDVNERNEAVVSLQENNHIVIVDLPSHSVVGRTRPTAARRRPRFVSSPWNSIEVSKPPMRSRALRRTAKLPPYSTAPMPSTSWTSRCVAGASV